MKLIALTIALSIFHGIAISSPASEMDDPDSIFDGVLSRHVSEDGLIDYKCLAKDTEFIKYTDYLSNKDPDTLPSDKYRLAFWINAYNAFVLTGITKEECICIGKQRIVLPSCEPARALSVNCISAIDIKIDRKENCIEIYRGHLLGMNCQRLLDYLHLCSAGVVSFARGLNDTPKIVALMLLVKGLSIQWGMLVIALGMAAGGLLNAKKVAETMSNKITRLNHGQGFTANLVTAILVIFVSKFGMPVSTTHVSVGSLFGIGLTTRGINSRIVLEIFLSWLTTLPVAAIFSGGAYWILTIVI